MNKAEEIQRLKIEMSEIMTRTHELLRIKHPARDEEQEFMELGRRYGAAHDRIRALENERDLNTL